MKKILKTYKFRLYPNKTQEILLSKTFGCARFIFNQMLAERKEVYEQLKNDKDTLFKYKYKTEKQYKEDYDWLKEVDSVAVQQSRVDLDEAYKNFFKSLSGKRKGKQMGLPNFKSKKTNRQTFRTLNINNNIEINFENKILKLPKLKWIKYSDDRIFNGIIKNVTVEKTPTGKYFACILVEEFINTKIHQVNSKSKAIGLDYDSKNLFTSNENKVSGYPRFFRKYEKKLAKEQRRLSRKVKGSNNRNKQRIKVAKVHEKIVNSRKDFHQKLSTEIVRNYDIIGIETLNMQAMSQCLNFGKSVSDNGWGMFRTFLQYKLEDQGKQLFVIDKWFPSSKMCNVCGCINKELTLADREWTCDCGVTHDRDLLASKNIKNFGIEQNRRSYGNFNACGEILAQADSKKQEAQGFILG